MGVKVYYYVVAAVLGFGFLIPQHGNKKKYISHLWRFCIHSSAAGGICTLQAICANMHGGIIT